MCRNLVPNSNILYIQTRHPHFLNRLDLPLHFITRLIKGPPLKEQINLFKSFLLGLLEEKIDHGEGHTNI